MVQPLAHSKWSSMNLRQEGIKAGLLRLRTFRPFPVEEIQNALKNVKAIAVLDKSMSFGGNGGAVFHEVRHALYDCKAQPLIVNYIYGLGGRDTAPKNSEKSTMTLLPLFERVELTKLVTLHRTKRVRRIKK